MLAAEKRSLRKRLGKLKDHERLLIRRKRLGNTQNKEAKRLGVSRYMYRKWELGKDDKDIKTTIPNRLRTLGIFEICFLLRKRNGLTVTKLAQEIGVSKTWVSDMELGTAPIGDLVKYWIARYDKSKS
jgi:transcriptional regulator with XRE-family HTH domain